jgi:glycosyltransferase involved in cell wall biosynthesis
MKNPVQEISLLISTYNWPAALELLLLSSVRQSQLPAEILIADDGSGEETRELIRSYLPLFSIPVKHIWQADNGFRKTIILNKAIKASSGEYIIQVDGDVILDTDFIRDHWRVAEQKAFVRGTRAHLTPAMTIQAIESKRINYQFYSRGVKHRNNAARAAIFSKMGLGISRKMSSHSVRGSNLAFWKKDFILVNGYNNDLCGWGHEDEELAARFINNGIIKKKVKLAAIQYHLYHYPVASAKEEPQHRQLINRVIEEKITKCDNGFDQVG